MKEHYDVIVVGTGAAGLYCALNLPDRKNILMITKKRRGSVGFFSCPGRSLYAQRRRGLWGLF